MTDITGKSMMMTMITTFSMFVLGWISCIRFKINIGVNTNSFLPTKTLNTPIIVNACRQQYRHYQDDNGTVLVSF